MLIFTSGTSGDPKAVKVSHFMVLMSGANLVQKFDVTADDTCYLSMPLFHSNALVAGWGVAVATGAAMAPAKFSASRFLDDIRRYGATYMNYVGKPLAYILATPERPDDADNPLRVAFGNEASDRDIDEFSRRFDTLVWDGFGSSENAVIITREPGTPKGSLGKGFPGVAIYNPDTVTECPAARFDADGALINADEAVGELVNTSGTGFFTGYYNGEDATAERMRHGMYWSGDLAYRDADGWIYLAGRSADWMRVDGENMAAAPIERILVRLPDINRVAVYAVPDENVGDQIMAAVVLNDDAHAHPGGFRVVPGRAARSVAEGVAAVCPHHRRPADHRDAQGAQARTGRAGPDSPATVSCGCANRAAPATDAPTSATTFRPSNIRAERDSEHSRAVTRCVTFAPASSARECASCRACRSDRGAVRDRIRLCAGICRWRGVLGSTR